MVIQLLFTDCVCLFLFFCFPLLTCSWQTAPSMSSLCPLVISQHGFLLSAFGRVLEGALSLHIPMNFWTEYWCILGRMVVELLSAAQEQWSLISIICLSDLFLRLFPVMVGYFFIYFLYHSGYAVAAGHFSQPTTTDIVGGAPQDGGIGKVWLFIKQ